MPHERRWSLRRRMLMLCGGAVLAAWLCGGAAILVVAEEESERLCHENLYFLANTVMRFAGHELSEVQSDNRDGLIGRVHHETEITLGERYAYQIWSRDGQLLLRSMRARADRPYLDLGLLGLHEVVLDTVARDAYAVRSPGLDMTIQVIDLTGEVAALSGRFITWASLSFLLSFVPLVLGTRWLVNRAFSPVRGASAEIRSRGAHDLAPLRVVDAPGELAPFIGAMNSLMERMRGTIEREREFTALAAHELRTPLAAMRMQAQVLARTVDETERTDRAGALLDSVDRCSRLSTQLLHLSRADAMAMTPERLLPVPLDEACAEVLADFLSDAERRKIEVACELTTPRLLADRVGLQTLLRNLVANAMRHTPDAGCIRIDFHDDADATVLRVDDSGAGISDGERKRVFQRFYRSEGARGVGVGLGLSIVASIVKAHRAAIALGRSPLGGLRVEVRFPRHGVAA